MVKPSKRMQPEAVDLDEINKKGTRGMGGDDFSNYLARKISLQREQFGLVLPPEPSEQQRQQQQRRQVRFADDFQDNNKKRKVKDMSCLLKRLKKRHGSSKSRKRSKSTDEQELHSQDDSTHSVARKPQHAKYSHEEATSQEVSKPLTSPSRSKDRPDLFFRGVVVLINGYTSPDTDTLMRLLHKHGGDLEKYETTRITHIIAQNLSTAKANMYKRQRNPRPVCCPEWIVESAKIGRLLPHGDYLIDEVQPEATSSVKKFFVQQVSIAAEEKDKSVAKMDLEKSAALSDLLDQREMGGSKEGGNVDVELSAPLVVSDNQATNAKTSVYQSDITADTADTATESQTLREPSTTTSGEALTNASSPTKPSGTFFPHGTTRTTGTDPNFLQSFFSASRLSFIGSFKQRERHSPTKKVAKKSTSSERFVFLVDMDSFFASVVLRNFPEYRDKPVAISHMGKQVQKGPGGNPTQVGTKDSTSECATCNYEARKYGIKKGMFLGRARELCPPLVVLPYDFEGYEEVSEQVADILYRLAEVYDGTVEQSSCDEAYVELFLSSDDCNATPEELAWKIAEGVREEVFETTRCTATVGVASNKLLAKLAADQAKPNKAMVVKDYRSLLEPLNLRDLHGIGYRMERKLTEENLISVSDVWDLGNHAESELIRILGSGLGRKIWRFCKGVDDRPVMPAERKTIGAEVRLLS
jgi:DNA repair protein REV1